MVNKKIIEIVQEYLLALKKKNVYISKAFLFGSQANGTATENSDIDLMLVSPLFDEEKDKYASVLWFTAGDISYLIEPLAIGEYRFNTDNISPIVGIVKSEGVEVSI